MKPDKRAKNFIREKSLFLVASIFLLGLHAFPGTPKAETLFRPVETDELLKNPGMGWMTYSPAAEDRNLPADIPTSIYYKRLDWKDIHLGPGLYKWEVIDDQIQKARKNGQQYVFRIMPVWETANSPLWMREAGYNGFICNSQGPKWLADLNDPRVQAEISKFLQQLAARYDRHPDVYAIEISFLGCWGEGNTACGCPEGSLGTDEIQRWLMEEHYKYFKNLPILNPAPGESNLAVYAYQQYGSTRGAGLFMDCWGDYARFSSTWNHMEMGYPQWLNKMHGSTNWDFWQRGILRLETCGNMSDWIPRINDALQWAIDRHASYFGNKWHPIPSGYKEAVKQALKKIGYRLVLREARHTEKIRPGESLALNLKIENVGVAPPYRDYYLAAQLKNSRNDPVQTYVSTQSVKFWLPGTHNAILSLPIQPGTPDGTYKIAIGIVNPFDNQPIIRMPIEYRESSGWHPISAIQIGAEISPTGVHPGPVK